MAGRITIASRDWWICLYAGSKCPCRQFRWSAQMRLDSVIAGRDTLWLPTKIYDARFIASTLPAGPGWSRPSSTIQSWYIASRSASRGSSHVLGLTDPFILSSADDSSRSFCRAYPLHHVTPCIIPLASYDPDFWRPTYQRSSFSLYDIGQPPALDFPGQF